jgi:glycosyltransferase involved in cell wall biosynthesis
MRHKKLSVITINLNNREGLEKTMESVISQTFFRRINYVIIDGGSTDGSIDVIRKYEKKLSYWVSEPDGGIYNAMNKGLDQCNTDYVMFLNSGDNLAASNVIERAFSEFDGTDIIYGDMFINNKLLKLYPDVVTQKYLIKDSLPHPASFIRRKVLASVRYCEDYDIVSDWIFWYDQILKKDATYRHLHFPISNFMLGGTSSDEMKILLEKRRYIESIAYSTEIAVIVPCFNQGKYVKETIDSLKAQTYKDFYCVIINDGSTDDSGEIIKNEIAGDERFHYLEQENKGLGATRNIGIRSVASKYILCLDSDDRISPTYIEDGVRYLNEHDDVSAYYGKAKMFYNDGTEKDWKLPPFNYTLLLFSNHIYCSYIYRRRDYMVSGGYDENMKGYEDWDFAIRLFFPNKKAYRTDDVVFYYRRHEENMDAQLHGQEKDFRKLIQKKNAKIYHAYAKMLKNKRSNGENNTETEEKKNG